MTNVPAPLNKSLRLSSVTGRNYKMNCTKCNLPMKESQGLKEVWYDCVNSECGKKAEVGLTLDTVELDKLIKATAEEIGRPYD